MTEASRTRRSLQNAAVAVGSQIVITGLSFVTRTVFIAYLGTELVGVHTLLVSLMAMLAVADLGVNAALMHALYRPLRDGDHPKVSALVRLSALFYRRVALGVAVLGFAALPFLDQLVNLDRTIPHLHLYFLVLLVDAVAMYLMIHRSILVTADQRMYLVKVWTVVFAVLRSALQISALVLWQSFLAFLIIQAVFTLLTNLNLYWRSGRWYPYLRYPGQLTESDRKSIGESVRAMIIYRVGGIVLHNSDPLLISVIVGTTALGYYSNYLLIVGAIVMLIEAAFQATGASIGNLIANRRTDLARRVLDELTLVSTSVYGMSSVGLAVGLDPFIRAWLGEGFVLGPVTSAAVAVNVYVVGTMAPVWGFRGATGMFRETQYVFALTAFLNIVLSIVMGHAFGLAGILFATAAARLLTGSWYEPWVLLRRHLHAPLRRYFMGQAIAMTMWGSLGIVGVLIVRATSGSLVGAAAWTAAMPCVAWLAHRRSPAFHDLRTRLAMVVKAS